MSLSAREFQVLVRSGESVQDRMTVLERCCQRSGLNYLPPDLLEPDCEGLIHPTILFEYRQPHMGKDFVPVIACRWNLYRHSTRTPPGEKRDRLCMTTGVRHVTWARPIVTGDTVFSMTHKNAMFDPVEIDAFFERAKMMVLVHKERIRLMGRLLSEREALDFYLTAFRAIGAFGSSTRDRVPRTSISYVDLLPRDGERMTLIEHLSFLTGACRSRDPWVLISEFGRISDHLIQNIEPLHQKGNRITFRLGVKR